MHRVSLFLDYICAQSYCENSYIFSSDKTLYMPNTFSEFTTPPSSFITKYFTESVEDPSPGQAHWFIDNNNLYLWRSLISTKNSYAISGNHVLEISSNSIFEESNLQSLQNEQGIYLIDADLNVFGINVSSDNNIGLFNELFHDTYSLNSIKSYLQFTYGGEDYLIHTIPLYKNELYLVSTTPVHALLSKANILLFTFGIIGIISTVFSSLFIIFSTSTMTKSIHVLTNSIHNFSLKNFNEIPVPAQRDDVTDVIVEFNHMGTKIMDLMEDVYYAELKQKNEELRALQFQYSALQTKINPHFLYNTLETISSMAKLSGANDVSDATCALGSLLRQSTRTTQRTISLQEELSYTSCYLEIHKLNLGDKLSVVWDFAPETLHCFVPRLILQPIIENAIIHGLENNVGPCNIMLRGIIADDVLILSVSDNGCGITPEKLNKILYEQNEDSSPSEHIGISSVHKRVRILYGEKYGVSIKSLSGHGTVVAIVIPVIKNPPQETFS